ncbi:hypothetical protein J1N35_008886 [Gossypium stocksii]|uniref:Reverse transcriptase zinc-binding domain-containing protein n=1 Tax=Gossypium stocksii TaxID=47602 RepID=A0A9D3WA56_9ROSI|nr:hypothetical protein J1N35_008886 [Gossypium stocksii]
MSTVWRGIIENSKDDVVSKWVGTDSFYWQIGNGKEKVMINRLVERVSRTVLVPDMEDKICWVHDRSEEFSVRKYSELLILDCGVDSKFAFDRIWKLNVPPRVHSFLWMLAINRIPTKEFLVKRGVNLQNLLISCPWCERVPESASHLFFKCKFIEGFWIKIFNWWEPLPHRCLKFNASEIANEDRVGYEGVLRDKEGVIRALFSSSAATNDFDVAEIGTVNIGKVGNVVF